MAKNASWIRKLLKIAAKSESGEASRAGLVFARFARSGSEARPALSPEA
jgi:hypothetical protein